jgi:molybdenum cofactor cytidylyltransferase
MVTGLVVAGGRSTRMGTSKALLPWPPHGVPFVVHIARALVEGGVDGVVIVGRPDDLPLQQAIHAAGAGRFVANPDADAGGQLSSLIRGLDACERPGVTGVMMSPVDVPGIDAATVAALLAAFRSAPDRIVRATHAGRHGHPVIFPRLLLAELRAADPARGAKMVVRAHDDAILNVEVPTSAVVDDIDTPEDYRRIVNSE